MTDKGFIFDIKKFAIHDGPGIRSTVFLKGCPLTCWWCHNPEGQSMEPEKMEGKDIVGRRVTVDWIMNEVEKDRVFYDQSGGGVTFSGGEPLMQPAFLHRLLLECAAREIRTVVDTTCHAPRDVLESISEDVGLFFCDLKHMDDDEHERLTGMGNRLILDNIRWLATAGANIALRMPVVPGFNDDEWNIDATARFTASLDGVSEIDLLPYNGAGRDKANRLAGAHDLLDVGAPSDGQMKAIAEVL